MENKHVICDLLLLTLKATDNLKDLKSQEFDEEKEIVTATFMDGREKKANVVFDSGTAMISDIVRQIV